VEQAFKNMVQRKVLSSNKWACLCEMWIPKDKSEWKLHELYQNTSFHSFS
jgi:hypothetical protein